MFSCHCVSSILISILGLWVILPSAECFCFGKMKDKKMLCNKWPQLNDHCSNLISKYKFPIEPNGKIMFEKKYRNTDWFRNKCVEDFCEEAKGKATEWNPFMSKVFTRMERYVYSGKDVFLLYNQYKGSKKRLDDQEITLIISALITVPSEATRNKLFVPLEKRTLSLLLCNATIDFWIKAINDFNYTSVDLYDFLQYDIYDFYNRYKHVHSQKFPKTVPLACKVLDIKVVVVTYSDAKIILTDEVMFWILHSACSNKEVFKNRTNVVKKILDVSITKKLYYRYTMAMLAKVKEKYCEDISFFEDSASRWTIPEAINMAKKTCGNSTATFAECVYSWVKVAFHMRYNDIDRIMVQNDFAGARPDQSSLVGNLSRALVNIQGITVHYNCKRMYNRQDIIIFFYIGYFSPQNEPKFENLCSQLKTGLSSSSCSDLLGKISSSVSNYVGPCHREKPNSEYSNYYSCRQYQSAMSNVIKLD